MAATIAQIQALADSPHFQVRVRGAIYQKASAILDDVRVNANLNYTAQQATIARNICTGSTNVGNYFGPVAGATNVTASNVTYNFEDRVVVTDISDAALASQIFTTVWQDIA